MPTLVSIFSNQEHVCESISSMLMSGLALPAFEELNRVRDALQLPDQNAQIKYATPILCSFLDVIAEMERLKITSHLLALRNSISMVIVPMRISNTQDENKVKRYMLNMPDSLLHQNLKNKWFLSRIMPQAETILISETDEYFCQSTILSVGESIAAVLYKCEAVMEGVKFAVRLFNTHSFAASSFHTLGPTVGCKAKLFIHDHDNSLHGEVTALALSTSGDHICCALSNRLMKSEPAIIRVYCRAPWQLLSQISVSFTERIVHLQWRYLDYLLIASNRLQHSENSEQLQQQRDSANMDLIEDDSDEDDGCQSVLHRLGDMLFYNRRLRSLAKTPCKPRDQLSNCEKAKKSSERSAEKICTAFFFNDWNIVKGTCEDHSPLNSHLSGDEDEIIGHDSVSGHATPIAYHSTPIDQTKSAPHIYHTNSEWNSPAIDFHLSPYSSKHKTEKRLSVANVIKFNVMLEGFIPFIAKRNVFDYVASELLIKRRQAILQGCNKMGIRSFVEKTQAISDDDNTSAYILSIIQWLDSRANSNICVINIPREENDITSAVCSVSNLADAFLCRNLSTYVHLGPPFCWAHSFSKSYQVVMFVAHQLASKYQSHYSICVVRCLKAFAKKIIDQYLTQSSSSILQEWGRRFSEDLFATHLAMNRRILFLDDMLISVQRNKRILPIKGETSLKNSHGNIDIPCAIELKELHEERNALSLVQKSIHIIDCSESDYRDNDFVIGQSYVELGLEFDIKHFIVPNMSILSLDCIYNIYVGDPLLILLDTYSNCSTSPVMTAERKHIGQLDLVIQVEISALSKFLTDECSSSSVPLTDPFWHGGSPLTPSMDLANDFEKCSNQILRVDTTEDCDGIMDYEFPSANAVCSEPPYHYNCCFDTNSSRDSEDSVASATIFLLLKLSELCKNTPALRVIIFSNMFHDEEDGNTDQFPALTTILNQDCVAQIFMHEQPFIRTFHEACLNILRHKFVIGQAIVSGQSTVCIDDMATFVVEKVCCQSIDYAHYLWKHLLKSGKIHSNASEEEVCSAKMLENINGRLFDEGYFLWKFSVFHLMTGPAYSEKVSIIPTRCILLLPLLLT